MRRASPPAVLADPIGVIVDLVDRRSIPALDRATVQPGRRAGRGGPGQAPPPGPGAGRTTPSLLIDGRSPAPRAVGDLLHRAARGRRDDDLAAGLRRVRQDAAHPATPRRGLVLRGLRPASGTLRRLRADTGRSPPATATGGPAARQCPTDDDRDPVQILRRGSSPRIDPALAAGRGRRRDRRPPSQAGQRAAAGLGLQDRPDLLTGAGAQAPRPVGAAADRRALRRPGATQHRPRRPARAAAGSSRLVKRTRRAAALPQLRRQVPRRALLALRRRPRSRPPATSTGDRCVRTA